MITNTDIIFMDFSEFNSHYLLSGVNHPNGTPLNALRTGGVSVSMRINTESKELRTHRFKYDYPTLNESFKKGIESLGEAPSYTVLVRIDGLAHKALEPQYQLSKENGCWTLTRSTPYVNFPYSEMYPLLALKKPGKRVAIPEVIDEALRQIKLDIKDKIADGKEDLAGLQLSCSMIRVTAISEASSVANKVSVIDYEAFRLLGPDLAITNMICSLANTFNDLRCACPLNEPPMAFFKVEFVRKGQFDGDDTSISAYVCFDNQGKSTVINNDISILLLRGAWLLCEKDVKVNAVEDIIFKLGDDYYSALASLDEKGVITINDKTQLTRGEFKHLIK